MFHGTHDNPPLNHDEQRAEREHYARVVASFLEYERRALEMHAKRQRDFSERLPKHHRALLQRTTTFAQKLDAIPALIHKNGQFLAQIAREAAPELAQAPPGSPAARQLAAAAERVTPADMDKVASTLRQFVRDWSADGAAEREATYGPILAAICERFPNEADRAAVRVLVPGAGLARLAYELVQRGFSVQGNEFSFPMLFGSHFVLNTISRANAFTVYPYVGSLSNSWTTGDALAPVAVPDEPATGVPPTADFSMVAGDFLEVYSAPEHAGAWDVVVTCFFIDTARNPLAYLERIAGVLKRGSGLWINLGPLLYHYEGVDDGLSIELAHDELCAAVRASGFEFIQAPAESSAIRCTYAGNPRSMLQSVYACSAFVAQLV